MSVLACSLASSAGQSSCVPVLLGPYEPTGWPEELDWGIYWFGRNDKLAKAAGSGASELYDPSKPTLIFFHGWTGGRDEGQGWVANCRRVTTSCPKTACTETGEGTLLAEPWLDRGWNVGFFYWDQFADEPCPRHAEQKIWFDRSGDGIRWKSYKVSNDSSSYYQLREDGVFSVADLCARGVNTAMSGYHGGQVRFAGHSIGAQLAVRCANLLHEQGHEAAPQRLALLEPFFTKPKLLYFFNAPGCQDSEYEEHVGGFTEQGTSEGVSYMRQHYGVVTEVYKSSIMTEPQVVMGKTVEAGTSSAQLENLAALVRYRPQWCGGLDWMPETLDLSHLGNLMCRHLAVFPLYFLSMGGSPPVASTEAPPGPAIAACLTPSASCDDESIRMWQQRQLCLNGTTQRWSQVLGVDTLNVSDDSFELAPALQGTELSMTPSMAAQGCSGDGSAGPLLVGMEVQGDSAAPEAAVEPEASWHGRPVALILGVVALAFAAGVALLLVRVSQRSKQRAAGELDEESDSRPGNQPSQRMMLMDEFGAE